jgi:hydroxymethylglutaryl-CoA synthase
MLLGANAPVALDRAGRASHMTHSYDFFKPHLSSPYPVVDGRGSAICYLRSLDTCYQRMCDKRKKQVFHEIASPTQTAS